MAFNYSLPGGCSNHVDSCNVMTAVPFMAAGLIIAGLLAWRAHRVISRLDTPDPRPVGFFTWYFLVSVVFPLWKLNRTDVLAYAVQFRKRLFKILGVANVLLLVGLPFAMPLPPGFLLTFAVVVPAGNIIFAIGPIAIGKALATKNWDLPKVSFWKHHETWLT